MDGTVCEERLKSANRAVHVSDREQWQTLQDRLEASEFVQVTHQAEMFLSEASLMKDNELTDR